MLTVYFDTETTGLPPYRNAPYTHPGQPRIVQLAAILADEDGKEWASLNAVVQPEGFTIPAESVATHGITTGIASAVGVPLVNVLGLFSRMLRVAEAYCGHNVDYDVTVVSGELHRLGRPILFGEKRRICTKDMTEPLAKLPPTERMIRAGFGQKFKPPTLQEAHAYLFGAEFDGAHDALADVRACARVHRAVLALQGGAGANAA